MAKVSVTVNMQDLKQKLLSGEIQFLTRDMNDITKYGIDGCIPDKTEVTFEVESNGWHEAILESGSDNSSLLFKNGSLKFMADEYECNGSAIFENNTLVLTGIDSTTVINLETGNYVRVSTRGYGNTFKKLF